MSDASKSPLTDRYPWLVFLLPFIVYAAVGTLEPTPDKPGGMDIGLAIPYAAYPWVYTAKIVATLVAMGFVLPGYRKFPFRVSPLAVLVGVVGVVVWVGLCHLEIERRWLGPLGLERLIDLGRRPGYNPLAELAEEPAAAWAFLAVRLFGMTVVVAIIEEFFLRGFLMRLFVDRDWWDVPFGTVNTAAVIVGTVAPMLTHPAELVAAGAWFSMVTWLMVKTRNIWDCVVAHMVTNLLLGIYVVLSGNWQLM